MRGQNSPSYSPLRLTSTALWDVLLRWAHYIIMSLCSQGQAWSWLAPLWWRGSATQLVRFGNATESRKLWCLGNFLSLSFSMFLFCFLLLFQKAKRASDYSSVGAWRRQQACLLPCPRVGVGECAEAAGGKPHTRGTQHPEEHGCLGTHTQPARKPQLVVC